ncbi:YycH family regulatory protein [Loigolactobacillus zhaoyuanensis]|uniref:YycH family regulatory protein n=1 Tax=Loigolactobacillus zhaoyuanensis TaxID=2486017 RepID=UPI000F743676|nr:two-component system activity regulator YycH [Loigolactobacillus zhaoyuanensis]
MKISHLLLKISLLLMIGVSIVLSWLIWTNNARFQRNTIDVTTPKTQTETKNVEEVYLPTQIITTDTSGNRLMVYNNKENMVDALHKKLSKWRFSDPKKMTLNSKNYLATINQKSTLSLLYPRNITYAIFSKTFKQKVAKADRQRLFNRIIIPTKRNGVAYFIDDYHKTGFSVKIDQENLAALQARLSKTTIQLPVTEKLFNDQPELYYTNAVQVTQYSYLVTKQNPTDFVTSLLSGSDPSALETKEQDHITTYNDGTYKSLQVDQKNATIEFEDYSSDVSSATMTAILNGGYKTLSKIGNAPGNMRYFDYEHKTRTVIYRSYVEGLPVFNQTDFGAVKVQLLTTGVKLNFSVYTLQVPLPSDTVATPLPTTQTALDNLAAAGYDMADISSFKLGYHWSVNASSDSVIDLTPTYYFKYNGKWLSYEQLLNTTPNTDEGSGS